MDKFQLYFWVGTFTTGINIDTVVRYVELTWGGFQHLLMQKQNMNSYAFYICRRVKSITYASYNTHFGMMCFEWNGVFRVQCEMEMK